MCGIFGVLGCSRPIKETLKGLETLEYRGYDSAGVAYIEGDEIKTIKSVGGIEKLKQRAGDKAGAEIPAQIAVGHTRWATHGGVSEENSHPHLSADNSIAVVHNGIIENYEECAVYLAKRGIRLRTAVDTEVIPNILYLFYNNGRDIQKSVRAAMKLLKGDYAFSAVFRDMPDMMLLCKHGNMPLHVGIADSAYYTGSDILAFPKQCTGTITLESGEFAIVEKARARFFNETGEVTKTAAPLSVNTEAVTKNGFATFMEKEINEIPKTITNILQYYKDNQNISAFRRMLKDCDCVHIAGCGTSYHAGLIIGAMIEERLRIRTKVHIASEFNEDTILSRREICFVISQSGETADVIAAMKIMKRRGLPIVALCNVQTSTVARESTLCFPLLCGAEIAVASTKAFVASILVGAVLVGGGNGLSGLASKAQKIIKEHHPNIPLPTETNDINKIFFIGKGADYFIALESALKVKEITYMHCEGFPAAELKHGTLSLVDGKTLAVAYMSGDKDVCAKINNAVMEISARGGRVIAVEPLPRIIKIIPAQIFALQLSQRLGINPDRPRNLAKSVTVE
jgi:glucosamine--fructose-6-phosphate aminotransferase (isomerizing)